MGQIIAIYYSLVSLSDLIFQPDFKTREIFGKTVSLESYCSRFAHLTELTALQHRILQALNVPVSICTQLRPESREPP